jgi:hypothetical protein
MKSIPGVYSYSYKKVRKQWILVDSESARRAGIELHGSITAMEQFVSRIAAKKLQRFHERATAAPQLRRPRTEYPYDDLSGNPRRFMAIARAPWLNRNMRRLEWGFIAWDVQSATADLTMIVYSQRHLLVNI